MIEIKKPDARLHMFLPPVSPRPDKKYVPSQYALPFAHGGKRYVYHTLTGQCIEGALPASARAGEGWDDLIAARFLMPEDTDECAWYNQISSLVRAYHRKKGVRTYTILPTFGCNARCVYCYEEGMKPVAMTPETVEQVIRYILDTHAGGRVRLRWFGGEPLLGVGAIDRICEGLREAGLEYAASMVSNGSLITPEIVQKMIGDWKLGRIQISMDGAEQDYIARKHYYADRDNYHQVMNAVSDLSEAGVRVNIRCNVDEENWGRVSQFLSDLRENVGNKDRVSVYFAPLNAVRLGENDVQMWEKIRDARRLIAAAGFRVPPLMVMSFAANHCMADGGSVVITPDGSLYACEHCPEESRYGDIWHGVTDEKARKEFCRVDRTREKCRKCPFLPTCTSFASCPVEDTHCRQAQEMKTLDALKRMVEKKESENTEGENPAC